MCLVALLFATVVRRGILFFVLALVTGCESITNEKSTINKPCARATIDLIERKLTTGDSTGHGPDVGSDEWFYTVERRLGIEAGSSTPKKGTEQWCEYVISRL